MINKTTINVYGRSHDCEYAIISEEDFLSIKKNGITYERLENFNLMYSSGYVDEHIQLMVDNKEVEGFSDFFVSKYERELEIYEESLPSTSSFPKNFYVSHDEGWKSTNFSIEIDRPFQMEKLEIMFDDAKFNGELNCITYRLSYDGEELEFIESGHGKYNDFIVVDKEGIGTDVELLSSDYLDDAEDGD